MLSWWWEKSWLVKLSEILITILKYLISYFSVHISKTFLIGSMLLTTRGTYVRKITWKQMEFHHPNVCGWIWIHYQSKHLKWNLLMKLASEVEMKNRPENFWKKAVMPNFCHKKKHKSIRDAFKKKSLTYKGEKLDF